MRTQALALEAKPGHHRGDSIRVRIGVRRTRRKHVGDRQIALAIVGVVGGRQIIGEMGVDGERRIAGPTDDSLKRSLTLTHCDGLAFFAMATNSQRMASGTSKGHMKGNVINARIMPANTTPPSTRMEMSEGRQQDNDRTKPAINAAPPRSP